MSMTPEWRITPVDVESGRLPDEWQEINQRCFAGHPLLAADFFGHLLRWFGDARVRMASLVEDGVCLGVVLVQPVSKAGQRWQLFQPSQAPLGPIMLDHERVDTTRALSELMKVLPGFALQLDLTLLDPAFCKLPEDGGRAELLQHCTTMAVANEGSFEEYFNTRPRKLRSNLRRYAKRLQQDGFNERLELVTDPEAVAHAVDQHGDIETAGWKGSEGTAMHRDNIQGQFYRAYMRELASRGRGFVYRLWLNERMVACWLIVTGGEMGVMLKTAYVEDLAKYSVGRLVLIRTLEALFGRPDLRRLEFYTNANVDQLEWATDSRPIYHMNFYRYVLLRHGRQAARRARSQLRAQSGKD